MRYRRTPCLSKKQMVALEEQIRKCPERELELRRKDPRSTYKVYDDDGNIVAEFDPETDVTMNVEVDVKRRITKLMHSKVDDPEVKQNNKERELHPNDKARYDEAAEKYKCEFYTKYGYYPEADEIPYEGHRCYTYIDTPLSEDREETIGDLMEDKTSNFADAEETPASVMAELLATDEFDDRERIIYECKARRFMTDADIGKVIGTSGQYAGRIWEQMQTKIRNNPLMRSFYRF